MRLGIQIGAAAITTLAFAVGGGAAQAQSTCANEAICTYGTYNWLQQQNTNPLGGPSSAAGQYVTLVGDFYPNPFPSSWSTPPTFPDQQSFGQGTTVTASINGTTFLPPTVHYGNFPGEPYGYFASLPYSPSLVGAWNLSVSHPGYTTGNFTTYDTTGVPFIALANSINYSSLSPNATVSWTFPTVNVPTGMHLSVNFEVLNASGQLIDFYGLPGSPTSMDLGNLPQKSTTAGNPQTQLLTADDKFIIVVARNLINANNDQVSQSTFYSAFTSTSASPVRFTLPT